MALNRTQAQLSAATDSAVNTYAGKYVAYGGQYKGECLSLVKQIYLDITGQLMPGAVNGYNWSDSYWRYFEQSNPLPDLFIKVNYTPGSDYPKGSIVFYAATHHIAIWIGKSGSSAHAVFEQNADPDGSPAHYATRANSKITGILIPRTVDNPVGGKGAGDITQGDEMVTDSDNEYWRWNKLAIQIRGRNEGFSRDEFRAAAVGKTWLRAMEILSDDPEADASERARRVGQVAVRDNWEGQITGALAHLAESQKLAIEQAATITDLKATIESTSASNIEKRDTLHQAIADLTISNTAITANQSAVSDKLNATQSPTLSASPKSAGWLINLLAWLTKWKTKA